MIMAYANSRETRRCGDRSGFTLIEIVIAVAIVAILAGSITPLVFRELERAREEATLTELTALRDGLLEFYDDTGRLPTETEGLAALVNSPGATGWAGPYVGGETGDPVVAATTDTWQNTYQYDLSPTTVPAGTTRALVASAGGDRTLTMGSVGNPWTLTGSGDDLHVLVTPGTLERSKLREAQQEMAAIGDAGRRYFADRAAFPASAADVTDSYMDPGVNGGAFVDPWNVAYELSVDLAGTQPPDWVIRSFGPNRVDNGGGGDDLNLNISSVPPARETTLYRLEIAQLILNRDPVLALTGNWSATDRAALNLAAAFDNDGWGREYRVNVGSRMIFSTGSDGVAATTADNIPPGVGP
jgi:general secretion pathway protein G